MRAAAFAPLAILIALIALATIVLFGKERADKFAGAENRMAPSYALVSLDGDGMVTSDAFAGRPHLINLFASWCAPCRAEHPQLMALKAQGVEIVGVAYKDEPEASAAFLRQLGDPFAARAIDREGRFGLELGIAGVPETFVIGADGRIRHVVRGPLTEDVIAREIMPALAGS